MTVPDKMMNSAANMETRTEEELEKALARCSRTLREKC